MITTSSVRLDGASGHFAPLNYPAIADFQYTKALVEAAEQSGLTYRTGMTASSDTFYPGQEERYDTFIRRARKELQGSMKEWQSMGVLNYEMESATLLTQGLSIKQSQIKGIFLTQVNTKV
ncbi:hypothetical protein [Endozoicomonas sp. SCSIO W0465]|uniref:phosphorylase family protein n=1 Tax=Endozoicomonas sp. SCSIO W0465 TaxID=2918516 RepID=UPI0035325870